MKKFSLIAFVLFLVSLLGPLTLIFLYGRALLRPEEYASFIFRAGMAMYIIEFLSIHSSGMLLGAARDKQKKKLNPFLLLGLYTIFVVGFMVVLHCWFIGLYFIGSLCAKIFVFQSVKDNINISQIVFNVINLLFSTFIVMGSASLLKRVFPIPESVLSQRAEGSSGLFVEIPQTLLVWGVLYFSFTIIFNTIMFFRHNAGTAFQEA